MLALVPAGPAQADVVDDNLAAVLDSQDKVELCARGADGAIYTRSADGRRLDLHGRL